MRYIDKSLRYYADMLAARTPTPGGGSVAALLGTLGCGLLSMVAGFTLAKDGFNGYKERAKKALAASEILRKKFMALVDEDTEAYERLLRALKRHKDNSARVQPSLKKAISPPSKVCVYAQKAAVISMELAHVGSRSLISDISVAIHCLDAAFESALANIEVNMMLLGDRDYLIRKIQKYKNLQRGIKGIKNDVLSKVRERIAT